MASAAPGSRLQRRQFAGERGDEVLEGFRRRRRRPDADPAALVADGWAGARDLIASFTAAGLSKFVVRPATAPESLEDFVTGLTSELMPLQT